MHWLVGSFLVSRYGLQKLPEEEGGEEENKDIAMVILETRPTFWLPLVIKNALEVLGHQCTLYVVGTHEVHIFLQTVEPDMKYRPFTIEAPRTITTATYSCMLLQKTFWDIFEEPKVLVFQADCILLRPITPHHLIYDFLGARCGEDSINGGLSLRTKRAMMTALDSMTEEELQMPEDVAFTTCLRRLGGYTLPDATACDNFAIETTGSPGEVVGIHGTDKYFCDDSTIRASLSRIFYHTVNSG